MFDSVIVGGIEYRPYDHLYSVSKCGKVLRKLEPYEPWSLPAGYLACGRRRLLHRMVASVWIRALKGGEAVHHKNHNKTDNRASNLEITTRAAHMVDHHSDVLEKLGSSGISQEGREKLRRLRLGKSMPAETKAKISQSLKERGHKPPSLKGKKLSKSALAKRALNPPKANACSVEGVRYISFAEASRATGVHRFTIRKRCLSPNFPDYYVI